MPWLQLKIHTEQRHAESISDWLLEHGGLSVTFEDAANQPLFEPPPGETPLWSDTLITGLFDSDTDIEQVQIELTSELADEVKAVRSEILEDKNWVREWMEHYRPMNFSTNLWIVPTHHTPPDPNAINILLDPGLAFGTGTHPTTAMCLTWLAQNPPQNQIVVDYGCGSGILAIAAAMLGAKHVHAIDNDPQALIATRDNAQKNAVTELIECVGIEPPLNVKADTLVANILAGPLIELAERFSKIVRGDGKIVLSGILLEQAEAVRAAYLKWFSIEQTEQREEWALLSGIRRNNA